MHNISLWFWQGGRLTPATERERRIFCRNNKVFSNFLDVRKIRLLVRIGSTLYKLYLKLQGNFYFSTVASA